VTQMPMPKLDRSHSFPANNDDEVLVEELGLHQPMLERGVTLKNPQLLAVQFGKQSPRFILSFDKGMGKTLTYLRIAEESGVEQILLLCTRGAMLRQFEEVKKYFPQWLDQIVFIRGSATQRAKAWHTKGKIYVCTYATFLADMGKRKMPREGVSSRIAPDWCNSPELVIADEYHRVMRNRSQQRKKNATLDLLKQTAKKRLILSSGSAANKGPHSMWAALNLIEPRLFSSYWKYVGTYCVVDDTPFGKQIIGVKNVEGWRNFIAPYVFHRKKDLKDYPPKTRQALPVQMEGWQQKIHDDLKKKLITILPNDAIYFAPNTLAALTRIRQMMICPKFLDPSLDYGAGLQGIWDDVEDSELTHWVISTPYVGPMPYIAEFFASKGFDTEFLRGGMDMDQMALAIRRWTEKGGPMVQSIEFAESYELPAANVMYMLGYSHDPERNSQAEDRIHRDLRVTPHPVDIYYVKHLGAVDELIIDTMSMHADNVHALLNAPIHRVLNL